MRIGELREEKNLTQKEVADAINTSRTNIGRWEKGLNEPSASFVVQLADFFEVSTDYLLGRSDDLGNVTVKQTGTGLTGEEERLLRCFRTLSPADRAQAAEYLTFLMEKQNKK